MPKINVNEFADIVSAAGGTPKYNKVQHIKARYQKGYCPATDFYKPLRDQIKHLHQNSIPSTSLASVLRKVSSKKQSNYLDVVKGYTTWLKKIGSVSWFEPSTNIWSAYKTDINVNPELGLIINGTPHLIKLHFKSEKLSKSKADVITFIMDQVLRSGAPSANMCVLDIRESRLHGLSISSPQRLQSALLGEMAYIAAVW